MNPLATLLPFRSTVSGISLCFVGPIRRPWLALTKAAKPVVRACLRQYRASTWKRKLVKALAELSASIPIPVHPENSLPAGLRDLIRSVTTVAHKCTPLANNHAEFLLIIWPRGPRARIHSYFFDRNGVPVAFLKMSGDADGAVALSNEASALISLSKYPCQHFSVPSLIDTGADRGLTYVLASALPPDAILVRQTLTNIPHDVLEEFRGAERVTSWAEVESAPWWIRVLQRAPEIAAFLLRRIGTSRVPVKLARVHGDLGSENVFSSSGHLWIVDWECSTDAGPWYVDPLAWWLGANLQLVAARPQTAWARLTHQAPDNVTEYDLLIALAFLSGFGYPPAPVLARAAISTLLNTRGSQCR